MHYHTQYSRQLHGMFLRDRMRGCGPNLKNLKLHKTIDLHALISAKLATGISK